MGREIHSCRFSQQDIAHYRACLENETALLRQWFADDALSPTCDIGGFEIEACLVDASCRPAPINADLLQRLGDPLVVPELSRFNVEINTPPHPLGGPSLQAMHTDLTRRWRRCQQAAQPLNAELLVAGILPTLLDRDLTLEHMSPVERYRALNEQVLRMRQDDPITLDIQGNDHLHTRHHDVMLEAAATSLQIHLQLAPDRSVRYYNSAMILSAPMLAAGANSPYLFGHDLWDETRIPLFEQAVAVSARAESRANRVTFGNTYVRESLMQCFEENLTDYAVLLPTPLQTPPERLAHLCLHNGTLWRWNRPLIGFDDSGAPHLRLEHRVMPAGPSLVDMLANAALFYGLIQQLATADTAPESLLSFEQARRNFYAAARDGLRADLVWLQGKALPAQQLVSALLPLARQGLKRLAVDDADIDLYLGIIEGRLANGMNGAGWQRAYVAQHGHDMTALTCAYREHQRTGRPVHEWAI
jgi:gamma-glutamyl:cysteine ligase YbdK (ATP-grasp superfamily)